LRRRLSRVPRIVDEIAMKTVNAIIEFPEPFGDVANSPPIESQSFDRSDRIAYSLVGTFQILMTPSS
jgi:hypothetical protein